jgi:hypothetical protein
LTSFLDGRNGVSNHFAVDANIGYADDIEDSNILPSRYDVAGNESCVDCVNALTLTTWVVKVNMQSNLERQMIDGKRYRYT